MNIALLSMLLGSVLTGAGPDTIQGYAGFQFGMTLEEADRVRPDDKITDCEYEDDTTSSDSKCLEYTDRYQGVPSRFLVQFNEKTQLVDRIIVIVDAMGDCADTVELVHENLAEDYGPSQAGNTRNRIWLDKAGGSVKLSHMCVRETMGMVIVTYNENAHS